MTITRDSALLLRAQSQDVLDINKGTTYGTYPDVFLPIKYPLASARVLYVCALLCRHLLYNGSGGNQSKGSRFGEVMKVFILAGLINGTERGHLVACSCTIPAVTTRLPTMLRTYKVKWSMVKLVPTVGALSDSRSSSSSVRSPLPSIRMP